MKKIGTVTELLIIFGLLFILGAAFGGKRPPRHVAARAATSTLTREIWLTWTNPPDRDLATIRVLAIVAGIPDTLRLADHPMMSTDEQGNLVIVGEPGMKDSTRAALPCFSSPRAVRFYVIAVDSSENASGLSNPGDTVTP